MVIYLFGKTNSVLPRERIIHLIQFCGRCASQTIRVLALGRMMGTWETPAWELCESQLRSLKQACIGGGHQSIRKIPRIVRAATQLGEKDFVSEAPALTRYAILLPTVSHRCF